MIDKLMRFGMNREAAEIIQFMYDNKRVAGFVASEMGVSDETMRPLFDVGWIRVSNIALIDGVYYPMYMLNDLYKVFDAIYAEKAAMLRFEMNLARELKRGLNRSKVNRCRPPGSRIGRTKSRDSEARIRKREHERKAKTAKWQKIWADRKEKLEVLREVEEG